MDSRRSWRATPAATATALLLVLLATGSSAAAWSGVEVQGSVNAGVTKKTGGATAVDSVANNWIAFAGTEDLGGRTTLTFRLSTRFELASGAASGAPPAFWQGETTVGLKGPWGSLRAGRARSPINAMNGGFDAWDVDDDIASPAWWFFIPDFVADPRPGGDHSYVSQAVFYDSPTLAGWDLHLSAGGPAAGAPSRQRGLALNWEGDRASLMLGLERNHQRDLARFVGAAWQAGRVRWMAGYSRVSLNPGGAVYGPAWTNWAGAPRPSPRRSSLALSATLESGPHRLLLGLGRDFQGSTDGGNYIASSFEQAGTHRSGASRLLGIGYVRQVSGRTRLFADAALARWAHADDQGRRRALGAAVGMRHDF